MSSRMHSISRKKPATGTIFLGTKENHVSGLEATDTGQMQNLVIAVLGKQKQISLSSSKVKI